MLVTARLALQRRSHAGYIERLRCSAPCILPLPAAEHSLIREREWHRSAWSFCSHVTLDIVRLLITRAEKTCAKKAGVPASMEWKPINLWA